MRIHNILIGAVTFWGAFGFNMVATSPVGEVDDYPKPFKERWMALSYFQCDRVGLGFCAHLQGELNVPPPPRLYVSRDRSWFSKRALQEDR